MLKLLKKLFNELVEIAREEAAIREAALQLKIRSLKNCKRIFAIAEKIEKLEEKCLKK